MMTKRKFKLKAYTLKDLEEAERQVKSAPDFSLPLFIGFLAALVLLSVILHKLGLFSEPKPAQVGMLQEEPLGVLIDRISTEVGIHPVLAHALVEEESSKNKNAVSRTGAIGLTQVLWSTAKGEGVKTLTDLTVPETNLRTGLGYLKKQKDSFKTWWRALLAYKVGPGAVKRGHKATAEDLKYINNILRKCKHVMKDI